ncbi:MAG: hypothetical protein M1820_008904 [Bogoriella megaspora]|nr:MAG: hypothetical protein M1820_008904 [Bogoriella megaspora]
MFQLYKVNPYHRMPLQELNIGASVLLKGASAARGWNIMEYLPFRRMDLQADGSWKSINWPLPMGEVRDIPDDALIHGSVIKRMQTDPKYRPGNLICGGGGRGVKKAPAKYGMGEWKVFKEEGDIVGEVYVRANRTLSAKQSDDKD